MPTDPVYLPGTKTRAIPLPGTNWLRLKGLGIDVILEVDIRRHQLTLKPNNVGGSMWFAVFKIDGGIIYNGDGEPLAKENE
jgi:hypothetical protein